MSERYMIFIMEPVAHFEGFTPEQEAALDQRHRDFVAAIEKAGARVIASDPLEAPLRGGRFTPTADGGVLVTDGPFAETKEVVLGYYTVEVRDEEQARELAAQCPTAGYVDLHRVLPTGASVAK